MTDAPLAPGDENDRRVDDVGSASAPAEYTCRLGKHLIEHGHDGRRSFHERAQRCLARRRSPGLAEHPRRDDQPRAGLQRFADECANARIATLERDERACV
jgi:hypothetical protein